MATSTFDPTLSGLLGSFDVQSLLRLFLISRTTDDEVYGSIRRFVIALGRVDSIPLGASVLSSKAV